VKSSQFKQIIKRATPGEAWMSRLLPNRGFGYGGSTWTQGSKLEQINHYTNWSFVAINCIARNLAKHVPNMARVSHQRKPGKTFKYSQAPIGAFGGTTHVNMASRTDLVHVKDHANGNLVVTDVKPTWADHYGFGSQGIITSGSYYKKALSVVKPHEELAPLTPDDPLTRLFDNPNPVDTTYDLLYELSMFMELCGVGYLWAVPNGFGVPCELWVIPSHWVWPRCVGLTQPNDPHADELISYYELRPFGASQGMVKLPPEQVVSFPWKNPLSKVDGYSTMAAIARWIDTEESITNARWSQFINQARPSVLVEMGPEFQDPGEDGIARIEAKFAAKFSGEFNAGKPIIASPGTKFTPFGFNPEEMSYVTSEEQLRDQILSAYGVPASAVGITKEMTYGAILATLAALTTFCLNPRLVMMGQRLTKFLAPHFQGENDDEPIRIWWDDVTPPDPSQVNSDIAADVASGSITPNEIRAIRGRPAYQFGGNDPLLQTPGGTVPFPFNTGESQQDLVDLVPIIPRETERETEQEPAGAIEGETGQEKPPAEGAKPKPGNRLPKQRAGKPGIAEPNGPPSKKSLVKAIEGVDYNRVWTSDVTPRGAPKNYAVYVDGKRVATGYQSKKEAEARANQERAKLGLAQSKSLTRVEKRSKVGKVKVHGAWYEYYYREYGDDAYYSFDNQRWKPTKREAFRVAQQAGSLIPVRERTSSRKDLVKDVVKAALKAIDAKKRWDTEEDAQFNKIQQEGRLLAKRWEAIEKEMLCGAK
jgi:HK97 family phage portal protein